MTIQEAPRVLVVASTPVNKDESFQELGIDTRLVSRRAPGGEKLVLRATYYCLGKSS